MRTVRLTRHFAAFLALVFTVNTVFAHLPEKTFWQERAPVDRHSRMSQSGIHPLSPVSPIRTFGDDGVGGRLSQFGSVRKTLRPSGPSKGKILHIQDVHLNAEAQSNISGAIAALIESKQANVIALEGAFGDVDLSPLTSFPDASILRRVNDYLLREKIISGPMHAALAADKARTPRVVGIDGRTQYDANVEAYRGSVPLLAAEKKRLEKTLGALERRKDKEFNAALRTFDAGAAAYRSSRSKISDYFLLLAMHKNVAAFGPQMAAFSQALELEAGIDFTRVKEERAVFAKGGMPLERFPAIVSLLKYRALADTLDAEILGDEIDAAEKAVYAALAKTEAEREIVAESKRFQLERKLAEFALTSKEWGEYKRVAGERPLARPTVFENFYLAAEARDAEMARNLVEQIRLRQDYGGQPRNSKNIVLVTGGFHSAGIGKRLIEAGYAVTTFTPRITKIDSAEGTKYLSVFTQLRTPLDQLLEGDKLFLSPEQFPQRTMRFARILLTSVALVSMALPVDRLTVWLGAPVALVGSAKVVVGAAEQVEVDLAGNLDLSQSVRVRSLPSIRRKKVMKELEGLIREHRGNLWKIATTAKVGLSTLYGMIEEANLEKVVAEFGGQWKTEKKYPGDVELKRLIEKHNGNRKSIAEELKVSNVSVSRWLEKNSELRKLANSLKKKKRGSLILPETGFLVPAIERFLSRYITEKTLAECVKQTIISIYELAPLSRNPWTLFGVLRSSLLPWLFVRAHGPRGDDAVSQTVFRNRLKGHAIMMAVTALPFFLAWLLPVWIPLANQIYLALSLHVAAHVWHNLNHPDAALTLDQWSDLWAHIFPATGGDRASLWAMMDREEEDVETLGPNRSALERLKALSFLVSQRSHTKQAVDEFWRRVDQVGPFNLQALLIPLSNISSRFDAYGLIAISPAGRWIAVENFNKGYEIQLRPRWKGDSARTFKVGDEPVREMVFSPDGRWLAVRHGDDRRVDQLPLRLFSVDSKAEPLNLDAGAEGECRYQFSPDGERMAVWTRNRLRLWDLSSGKKITTKSLVTFYIGDVKFSADGKYWAMHVVGAEYASVWLFDSLSGTMPGSLKNSPARADFFDFSPNGKQLLIHEDSSSPRVFLFDLETQQQISIPRGIKFVWDAKFSPGGDVLALWYSRTAQSRLMLAMIDPATGKRRDKDRSAVRESMDSTPLFSPTGEHLAWSFGASLENLIVVNAKDGASTPLNPWLNWVYRPHFSPDGKKLAVIHQGLSPMKFRNGSADELHVYDLATGNRYIQVPLGGTVTEMRFSPDGSRIALMSVSMNVNSLRLFSTDTGREFTFEAPPGVSAFKFSPDGRWLAGEWFFQDPVPTHFIRLFRSSDGESPIGDEGPLDINLDPEDVANVLDKIFFTPDGREAVWTSFSRLEQLLLPRLDPNDESLTLAETRPLANAIQQLLSKFISDKILVEYIKQTIISIYELLPLTLNPKTLFGILHSSLLPWFVPAHGPRGDDVASQAVFRARLKGHAIMMAVTALPFLLAWLLPVWIPLSNQIYLALLLHVAAHVRHNLRHPNATLTLPGPDTPVDTFIGDMLAVYRSGDRSLRGRFINLAAQTVGDELDRLVRSLLLTISDESFTREEYRELVDWVPATSLNYLPRVSGPIFRDAVRVLLNRAAYVPFEEILRTSGKEIILSAVEKMDTFTELLKETLARFTEAQLVPQLTLAVRYFLKGFPPYASTDGSVESRLLGRFFSSPAVLYMAVHPLRGIQEQGLEWIERRPWGVMRDDLIRMGRNLEALPKEKRPAAAEFLHSIQWFSSSDLSAYLSEDEPLLVGLSGYVLVSIPAVSFSVHALSRAVMERASTEFARDGLWALFEARLTNLVPSDEICDWARLAFDHGEWEIVSQLVKRLRANVFAVTAFPTEDLATLWKILGGEFVDDKTKKTIIEMLRLYKVDLSGLLQYSVNRVHDVKPYEELNQTVQLDLRAIMALVQENYPVTLQEEWILEWVDMVLRVEDLHILAEILLGAIVLSGKPNMVETTYELLKKRDAAPDNERRLSYITGLLQAQRFVADDAEGPDAPDGSLGLGEMTKGLVSGKTNTGSKEDKSPPQSNSAMPVDLEGVRRARKAAGVSA